METWITTKRGTLKEINDWLKFLPKQEANYTKVEETISFENCSSNGELAQYEITVRLSGPHI